MGHQQIGAGDYGEQVSITLAHSRKNNFLNQEPWPSHRLHEFVDKFLSLLFGRRNVRTDGCKFQTHTFNLFTIPRHRRDHGHVTAAFQLQAYGHVGMNVAKRSEGAYDNSFRHITTNLCATSVSSVVVVRGNSSTTETQRTQRWHRENSLFVTFVQSRSNAVDISGSHQFCFTTRGAESQCAIRFNSISRPLPPVISVADLNQLSGGIGRSIRPCGNDRFRLVDHWIPTRQRLQQSRQYHLTFGLPAGGFGN